MQSPFTRRCIAALAGAFILAAGGCSEDSTSPPSVDRDDHQSSRESRTFLYANNDQGGTSERVNLVTGFRLNPNGSLTPVPGSPFPTGGEGFPGGWGSRATVTLARNFLFISNTLSNDISVFRINRSTGGLRPVPGSPFPTGGDGGGGISLAVTPDGRFLYGLNANSGVLERTSISAFRIAANGALTPLSESPYPSPGLVNPSGVKVTWSGKFLSVSFFHRAGDLPDPGAVAMFSIGSNGALTSVPGSPFPTGEFGEISEAGGSDIDCRNRFNFVPLGSIDPQISVGVFRIAFNGALGRVPGSPFTFSSRGVGGGVGLLSPDDRFLFLSGPSIGLVPGVIEGGVTVLKVASNGRLTQIPGSPFANPGGYDPRGMATNRAGTLLYVANYNNKVTGFRVAQNGTLTPVPGSPFATLPGEGGGLSSLTVYPAKSCGLGDRGHDGGDDDD
jgi:6-phosphogluconolactonase